ncbi:FtsW/RodA/SpoVE family cell cycle protein [Cytobacillus oceanisediminis]|uniref:FtsW/RodA/SpoVE family cell cycle protein n=1 Tax=Niallia alba TaxID=2729105 RepID=A0A7Y0PLU8_9BACI|nr:FtsW/RodA/SpoVE family cell cycle protein [Cytobacillus oceanisediminis]MBQ6448452.1 FtsW/RodA/SpoVE family cell cycle protein [Bacillus sp. (in: firmicutes)]MBZ9534855.1 FtsW/RodA/SpoVE family cell cycle protein [Cytobacillus oceanisediminis]NMO77090.1 FtsW/RodA/SpoVE family cell cycle protein [Niallia alba]
MIFLFIQTFSFSLSSNSKIRKFNVKKIKNQYAKFLLIGSITLYSVQVIYNLGMCMGFLPVISLSLPFISYGVVPTVINALLIGLILSVIRRKNFQ